MERPRLLLVYGTRYGQTVKIVMRLAGMFGDLGCDVDVRDAAELAPLTTLAGIDGVIVAASVIMGRHQRSVERFVRHHRDDLDRVPSAFLSVSGAAASTRPDGPVTARRQLERFLEKTGWQPRLTSCVAGAISYTEYGALTRWIIRSIQSREGGPVDTTRDHESTDWVKLQRFAEAFAALLPRVPEAPAAPAMAGQH